MTSEPFRSQLAALESRGRLRRLVPRAGRDFASNDYLGLASDPMIGQAVADAVARGVPVGSGGSRLLRGNAPEHEGLEAKAAAFFRTQAALFLANGFAANSALFSTLPQRGDLIVADELIHASVHDGIRLSKAATVFARHNDVQSFADLISAWRGEGGKGRIWIAVETLYSMDGDTAPLADLAKLAAQHDAMLILDEAHGTGVSGPSGRGLSAGFDGLHNVVTLHTCGKAMGVEGALICGPQIIIDYLINRARAFIFSTAPSPLMAVAASAALDRIEQADDLRARLKTLCIDAAEVICAPLGLPAPRSQIVPILLGEDRRAMAAAAALQEAGFDVRGIRPPTVPPGTSRLRISLTLNVGRADVAALGEELQRVLG
ncbi:8-amino-7-oxononanoate synthase [Sphingomonadales bacterium 56]|uniref:8-amino-7-oxononanoate synthase n=1 Tax=unclassified Sphingobium TaxID=2611147 RepID=UPI001918FD92|nr:MULTISPECIES: 8-amino-7-oxononanoate synthase [unclassified Sphingobium]MBY2929540.1 8-amino-7-oxononanoate synthase [Sphingomonadales bacterium 56]MBY2958618.1 8-amino-7-oxononanoate synthase [Sphingomonadales bacterium 58]CAD7337438.1 8-amino-7-oxononanoate synthase 2 [Sphingobium sp. S8]CAD7339636.1 8-amino-7-oxononanoate synthase 2 [Sphingobium sp. S6]